MPSGYPWQLLDRLRQKAGAGIEPIAQREIVNPLAQRLDRAVRRKGIDVVNDQGSDLALAQRALAGDEDLELVGLMEMRLDNRVGGLFDEKASRSPLASPTADVCRAVVAGAVGEHVMLSAAHGFLRCRRQCHLVSA